MDPYPNQIRFPKEVHTDNGLYRTAMATEVKRLRGMLNIKRIETLCLMDICRRKDTVIRQQEEMIRRLEQRIYLALNKAHPVQLKKYGRAA